MPRSRKRSLLDYLDSLLEMLRGVIPDAITAGEPKAVHLARTATRRFRAALDVIDPLTTGPGKKQLGKVLRKLRKSLGQTRDLDVMIGHLNDFKSPRFALGTEWFRQQLTERSAKSRAQSNEKLNPEKLAAKLGAWQVVCQDCADAGDEKLLAVLIESLHLQLDRFVEQADRQSGRVAPSTDHRDIDPHALRIAGKLLRYTLELAIAAGRRLPARVMRTFKRLQDALGLWHDFIVLADELLNSAVGQRDANLAISLVEMAKESLRRSQRQLMKFDQLWTTRGEEIARTIRSAFPLTHAPEPLSQMQTGRGLFDSPAPAQAPVAPVPAEPSTD